MFIYMANQKQPLQFIEPEIEDTSKTVNKAYLLTRQIDRIAQARTMNNEDIFIGGVKALMYMLSKEIEEDPDTKNELGKLKEAKSNLIKLVRPDERLEAARFYEFQMMEKVFELLMAMMRRRGITPEREAGEVPMEDVEIPFDEIMKPNKQNSK